MRLTRVFLAVSAWACICALASSASALTTYDFEQGLGRNAQAIGGSIGGLDFHTTSGGDVCFADINSGWYRMTSDDGTVIEDGEYGISGNVAACVFDPGARAKISFTGGTASYVSVGYSSHYQFFLEAYDGVGNLLAVDVGQAWTKSQGGIGLNYLSVSRPGISYVVVHDQGGAWFIDNLTTDVSVPEPATAAMMAGMLILAAGKRKRLGII